MVHVTRYGADQVELHLDRNDTRVARGCLRTVTTSFPSQALPELPETGDDYEELDDLISWGEPVRCAPSMLAGLAAAVRWTMDCHEYPPYEDDLRTLVAPADQVVAFLAGLEAEAVRLGVELRGGPG
jgi:hypothetical protein